MNEKSEVYHFCFWGKAGKKGKYRCILRGEKMIISERIFEILKERGMTQREFSIRTDISQSAISDWKRKKTNPSAEKIMLICNVLEVSPYDLLGEADTRTEISPEHIMIDRDSDEHYLIEKYHTLSKIKRSRVLGYIDALTDK